VAAGDFGDHVCGDFGIYVVCGVDGFRYGDAERGVGGEQSGEFVPAGGGAAGCFAGRGTEAGAVLCAGGNRQGLAGDGAGVGADRERGADFDDRKGADDFDAGWISGVECGSGSRDYGVEYVDDVQADAVARERVVAAGDFVVCADCGRDFDDRLVVHVWIAESGVAWRAGGVFFAVGGVGAVGDCGY